MKGFHLSLQMKRTFPFEHPVYANNRYAINRAIILYSIFSFGLGFWNPMR